VRSTSLFTTVTLSNPSTRPLNINGSSQFFDSRRGEHPAGDLALAVSTKPVFTSIVSLPLQHPHQASTPRLGMRGSLRPLPCICERLMQTPARYSLRIRLSCTLVEPGSAGHVEGRRRQLNKDVATTSFPPYPGLSGLFLHPESFDRWSKLLGAFSTVSSNQPR
jgi:hypothetical protein